MKGLGSKGLLEQGLIELPETKKADEVGRVGDPKDFKIPSGS